MLRIIFPIASILLCIAPFTVSAQAAGLKLYCAAVTTELGWSGTLPYTFQMCPLDAGSCDADKRSYSLQPESGRADSGTHCWFADEPVKFLIGYNADYSGGRDDVVQELVPIAFDWRGLYPDVWCLEDAAAYFTNIDGKLGLRSGYFRNVKRQTCAWKAPNDPSLPPPNSNLPAELVGSWVPKGKECPGFFDVASRTSDVVWVQPHAIERAPGACLLTGLFPLTPTLSVDTLCQTAKGNKRATFTFDRMDGDTMRLREGRGKRVTYKRCEKTWLVDPEQWKAAETLKGQSLSFILEIDARMREVKSRKTVDGSHTRKIELRVGDNGTLTDRMQIGDAAAPKTFTARFGEIAVDTDGDRATWRVEDGKMKRVRERKGYYEILSWPLNFDSRSVACEAEMTLAPTRSDGRLRTVSTDGAEYDVITAKIVGQHCPTESLSFAVASADKKARPAADDCIHNKTIGKAGGGAKSSHYLSFSNDCPFEPIVAVRGPWLKQPLITPIPSKGSGPTIGYSFDLNLPAGADPNALLKQLEFAALSLEEYRRSCTSVMDTDPGLRFQCFSNAYDDKYGKKDWSVPLWAKAGLAVADKMAQQGPSADECIKHVVETIKQDQIRAYNIVVENTCEFDIVVRLEGRGDPDITTVPASAIAQAPLFPYRNFDPEEFDRSMTYSALTAEEYKRNCGKLDFSDDSMDAALACFGKAYVAKHGEPDWAKDAKTAGGCVDADPDIAIKACTADIEAGKATANTLNSRAFAYMEKGQYDLALADLDNAIERDPKHDSALNNRGIVWMKKGEYRRAIEDFSKAIDLTTIEELRPYRQRAEAYAALGRHDEAIKDADEALKIDPDDDKARAVREASMKKRKAKSDETHAKSQRFDIYEKIHIRHILLNSETDAELVAKLLKGGADFAQTAKSLSIDEATAPKGGDLGWVGIGTLVKEFEDAAFALKPGEVSAPVKTQFGWHIIKLEEKRGK